MLWVDVLKGIGILCVVLGHVWNASSEIVNWFHMPLFFFLSGYLYSKQNVKFYFTKKIKHLLIPYFSFLIVLKCIYHAPVIYSSLIGVSDISLNVMAKEVYYSLYGGRLLTMWFGVFWFVTCLFITQQLYNCIKNYVVKPAHVNYIVFVFYVISMLNDFIWQDIKLPWNFNVAFLGVVFFHLGNLFRQQQSQEREKYIIALAIIGVLSIFLLHGLSESDLGFEMIYANYGVPFYSPLIAVCFIVLLLYVSKFLSRGKILAKMLSKVGAASMVIMYLHQPLHYSLEKNLESGWLSVFVLCVGGAMLTYFFLLRSGKLMNKLFLGHVHGVK